TASATHSAFGYLIKFILLTATRRSESAQMTRSEIDDGVWIIPAKRYKTAQEHVIPLSKAAQALLDEIPIIVRRGGYVFTTDGHRPISGFSKFKAAFDEQCGVSDWCLHDLRRTARSLMSRAGVDADIAERCLGHVIAGVRGVYDRHQYRVEMAHAFEALA